MNKELFDKLNHMSEIPKHGKDDHKQWLEQKEFLQFLIDTSSGEIPLYVSYKGTFIYSVFLPQSCLKGKYIDDLIKWDCRPDRSWEYCYSRDKHRAIDTHAFTGVVLVGTNFVCPDGNMLSSPPSQVGSSRYIKKYSCFIPLRIFYIKTIKESGPYNHFKKF